MRSIEYIEKNLKNPISINDVTDYTGYSIYHFIRIFNSYTGHSPYDYIMRRRLSQAALELDCDSCRITDIAFEYAFSNVETFSRAFRKMFGVLPNQFRKDSLSEDGFILRDPITYEYLLFINTDIEKIPKRIEMPEMKLLCICSVTEEKENEITPLCNKLKSLALDTGNLAGEDKFYRLSFDAVKRLKSSLTGAKSNLQDMICIKVSSIESIPDAAFGKIIPSSYYAGFLCKAHMENRFAYEYIFQTWLPMTGLKHNRPYVLEQVSFARDGTYCAASDILVPIT
jgi:AraC family transcriptional regulator